jgi:hypothetical protein
VNLQQLKDASVQLSQNERAELAKHLLVSVESKKKVLSTWADAWTEWVERHVPDKASEPDRPRTLQDDMHDIITEQAILDQAQVRRLLDAWFQDVPFLVQTSYDNLDHESTADTQGWVLMHPLVAIWNGVIDIDNAIARGVWTDFEEFAEMEERWSSAQD